MCSRWQNNHHKSRLVHATDRHVQPSGSKITTESTQLFLRGTVADANDSLDHESEIKSAATDWMVKKRGERIYIHLGNILAIFTSDKAPIAPRKT